MDTYKGTSQRTMRARGGSEEGGLAETTTGVAQRACVEEVVAAADTEGVTQRWEGCTGG